MRRNRLAVALAVAVLLALAVFGLFRVRRPAARRQQAPVAGPAATSPSVAGPVGAVPPTDARHGTAFNGRARSVQLEGRMAHLSSFHVQGIIEVDFQGHLRNQGDLGEGRLTVRGGDLQITGTGTIEVEAKALILRADVVDSPGPLAISLTGDATVAGSELRLVKTGENGDGTAVPGPVTVSPRSNAPAATQSAPVRWIDAPGHVEAVEPGTGRATLSWAGSGVVQGPDGDHRGQYLGLKASSLSVQINRGKQAVDVRGVATPTQIYVDGLAQLRVEGRVDLVRAPAAVVAGQRTTFTWAPRNSSRYDMDIMSVHPGSPQAGWVNLKLARLPAFSAGEGRQGAGGDTSGLGQRGGFPGASASAITSLILPGTADRRDITIDVPADTAAGRYTIVLLVDGNFPTIRVQFDLEVKRP